MWKSVSEKASDCWTAITEFFSPATTWFSDLFGEISQTVSDVFYNIGVIASGCWDIIELAWNGACTWFDENVIQPISGFFTDLWTDIETLASDAWEGIKEVFSEVGKYLEDTFSDAWEGVVKVFSPLGEVFTDIKNGVVSVFTTVVNGLIDGINKVITKPFNAINDALKLMKEIKIANIKPFSGLKTIHVPQIPKIPVETKAEGGLVDRGQMFIAREAGPELVGSIGRKTAVANNEQIVASVSRGVAEANSEQNSLLREQNSLLRELLEKSGNVYLDGKKITASVEKHQRERGRTIIVGGAV